MALDEPYPIEGCQSVAVKGDLAFGRAKDGSVHVLYSKPGPSTITGTIYGRGGSLEVTSWKFTREEWMEVQLRLAVY